MSGFAFTPNGPLDATVTLPSADDRGAALMGGISQFVQACGWEQTDILTSPAGYAFRLTSPQSLVARARFYYNAAGTIAVRMTSDDGTLVGDECYIRYRAQAAGGLTPPVNKMNLWGNVCTLFTRCPLPGINTTFSPNTFMRRAIQMGIPAAMVAVPGGSCSGEYSSVCTDAWFTNYDGGFWGGTAGGFRWSIWYGDSIPTWSACYNGSLRKSSDGVDGGLRIAFPLWPYVDSSTPSIRDLVWRYQRRPLFAAPILTWADTAADRISRARGLIYDTIAVTAGGVGDFLTRGADLGDFSPGVDWITYTQSKKSSWCHFRNNTAALWLMKPRVTLRDGSFSF